MKIGIESRLMQRRANALLALTMVLLPAVAFAHTGVGGINGFMSGFLHPISGPDHVVAMIAVGIWGAQLGMPAIWVLPVTFPIVMAFGGVLGVLGVPIPAVEYGIAFSGIILGLMVALAAKVPLWFAGVIVAVFAIFHGHAHGAELPNSANPMSYSAGFVISTGLLHLTGVCIGLLDRWPAGALLMRVCGAAIAAVGGYFLWVAIAG